MLEDSLHESLEWYKNLYHDILTLSFDFDAMNLDPDKLTDEECEMLVIAKNIIRTMNDVPEGRIWWFDKERRRNKSLNERLTDLEKKYEA